MNTRFNILTSFSLMFILILSILVTSYADAAGEEEAAEDDDDDEHCMDEFWEEGEPGVWMISIMFGGVFIVLVVFLLKKNKSTSSVLSPRSNAVEIAKERYAKGDITRQDYLQLLEDIKK